MPIFSKKEFAAACGIPTKSLAIYISRGKVVLTGEMIDTNVKQNQYFIEKRRAFNAKHGKKNGLSEAPSSDIQKLNARVDEKNIKEASAEFTLPSEKPTRNFLLDEQIKIQSIEKEKLSIELLKAKLDKVSGETIPTDLVKNLFIQHSKSITVAFQQGAENILSKIAKAKGIAVDEMAVFRTEIIEIINKAVATSIETSKKSVGQIVAEYSEKKGVGERT